MHSCGDRTTCQTHTTDHRYHNIDRWGLRSKKGVNSSLAESAGRHSSASQRDSRTENVRNDGISLVKEETLSF
ncbi:hypothetical protein BgiMline_007909 [Biomphalaria glabrata]